jgi:6-phosphogluconate dehydrogenase
MKIGIIGLGKMGYQLALNMRDQQLEVLAYNRSETKTTAIMKEGIQGFFQLRDLVNALDTQPRVIWLMVPAGDAVDEMIDQLIPLLSPHDIIIDGGNSKFSDTVARHDKLAKHKIYLVDAGTSGGVEGARNGACIMVGGDLEPVTYLQPVFKALSVKDGYLYCGKSGSGHYVKMIHNGIEYGMMQAIGEGFAIMDKSNYDLDFAAVAKVWANGSIIRGLLMDLTEQALLHNGDLSSVAPVIDANGEGQWTVEEAIKLQVAAPVITSSLFVRYDTKDVNQFSNKLVAALRNEFGGHQLHKKHD